jgi:RNA polymerase sigma factor for flagellar operon FliA
LNAATKTAKSTNQKSTDNTVRDALIVEHLPLVTVIAAHVQSSIPVHTELDDLVHAGMMGLFNAATKYQHDKEVAFPTYAKHRIKGAILDSLRQSDWASRDLRKRHKQMERLTSDLTAKLGRTPTQDELAEAMGLSSQRWQSLMVDFRNLGRAAFQLRATDRENQPLNDTPARPADGPDEVFARSEMRERLSSAMKTLPERYQQVVTLYYERDLTMKEIGGILGVNESRVSQIHQCALQRMQSSLGAGGIQSSAAF